MPDQYDALSFRQFELAGWERAVRAYDRYFQPLTTQALPALIEAAHVMAGNKVIDIASGPGYGAHAISQKGATVIGIDFSDAMVRIARERYGGIEFRKADAEDLPFDDTSVDCAVMNFGLLHFAEPHKALQEAFRVIKRGGYLAFSVWCQPEQSTGFGIVLDSIEKWGNIITGYTPWALIFSL